jgi:hypothetical protein
VAEGQEGGGGVSEKIFCMMCNKVAEFCECTTNAGWVPVNKSETIKVIVNGPEQSEEDQLRADLARLRWELEEGDYWMKRAREYQENGGCPWCFGSDEGGHKAGCYVGELEKLLEPVEGKAEETYHVFLAARRMIEHQQRQLQQAEAREAVKTEALKKGIVLLDTIAQGIHPVFRYGTAELMEQALQTPAPDRIELTDEEADKLWDETEPTPTPPDLDERVLKLIKEHCVPADHYAKIEQLEAVAQDVYRWLKEQNLHNTGHGRCLGQALNELGGDGE